LRELNNAALINDEELTRGVKNGYVFVVTGTAKGFEVSATPLAHGTSGMRSFFFSTDDGEIHVGVGNAPASLNDPTLEAYEETHAPGRRAVSFPQDSRAPSGQPAFQ
jgi:hypothetical protein